MQTVDALIEGAISAAVKGLASGELMLSEHSGGFGVWANGPQGRFFIKLASVAERAKDKVSEDTQDHFSVWVQGKSGRFIQVVVDRGSGHIMNGDEVLKDLTGAEYDQLEEEIEEELDDELEPAPVVADSSKAVEMAALGVDGGLVSLAVDLDSGVVFNWFDASPFVAKMSDPGDELAVFLAEQEVQVKSHLRGGKRVRAYRQKRPVAPIGAPSGARFVGYAPHTGYEVPKERSPSVKDNQGVKVSAAPGATGGYDKRLSVVQQVLKSKALDAVAEALGLPAPRLAIAPSADGKEPVVTADFQITNWSDENKLKVAAFSAALGSAMRQRSIAYHYAEPIKDVALGNAVEVKLKSKAVVDPEAMTKLMRNLKRRLGDRHEDIDIIAGPRTIRFISNGNLANDQFQKAVTGSADAVFDKQVQSAAVYKAQVDFIGGDTPDHAESAYKRAVRSLATLGTGGLDLQRAVQGAYQGLAAAFERALRTRSAPDGTGLDAPKLNFPDAISAPSHWAVFKHPGGEYGDYGLYHPETGDRAPEGVRAGLVEGRGTSGRGVKGFFQGRGGTAGLLKDRDVEDMEKLSECMRLSANSSKLKNKIKNDFLADGMTRGKLCAAVVLLMHRQLFRVGSKVGDSSVKSKGAVDETFGITLIRPEHVKLGATSVTIEFPGKTGKNWKRIESDKRTLELIKGLLKGSKKGQQLFMYEDSRGNKRNLKADDVREWLAEFGVTPHNFRHYGASLTYFQVVAGGGSHEEGIAAAAKKLNDELSATQKSYVLLSLQEAGKEGRLTEFSKWLKPLRLSEDFEDELEDADEEDADEWFEVDGEAGFNEWMNQTFHEHMSEVSLAESEYGGAPPKQSQLRQGDHWITLKPHGPDHPDYRRVLIRELGDGRAKIVWSGAKGLNHLVLNKVGQKSDIEREMAKKPKALTPEEREAEKAKRAERAEALAKNRQEFGEKMIKALGLEGVVDAEQFLQAYESKLKPLSAQKPEVDQAEKEKKRLEQEEKLKKLAEGEIPEDVKSIEDPATTEEAIAQAMLADVHGEVLKPLGGDVPPELQEKWNEIRKRVDPSLTKEVIGLINQRKRADSKIKKDTTFAQSVRVKGTMGWYDDPEEAELNLLKDHLERFEYEMRSQFVERAHGLGKSEKFWLEGHKDGLTYSLANFSGAGEALNLNSNVVHLFGPQVVAEIIAHHIRSVGMKDQALERLEAEFVAREFETVQEAMARSDELRQERVTVAREVAAGTMLATAAGRALSEMTIAEKKHLARAAGSLESVAQVLDSLRQETPRPITIGFAGEGGAARRDEMIRSMEGVGMEEGKDFYYVQQGGHTMLHVPSESAHKMLKTVQQNSKLNDELALIKSHAANTDDFEVPGMAKYLVRNGKRNPLALIPQQQAAIRMFEHDGLANHRVFGNLGVGLGKTITFGAAHARLMKRLKAEGKPHHSWYIVPAKLVQEAHDGLKEAFPGMNIVKATHSNREKRKEVYGNKADITIISSDMVRQDAEVLAEMCHSEHGPAAIYGDEVHELFTPNDNEDPKAQSRRALALMQLHSPHMLVMTGTPFRQSMAEVFKVINWLHPGAVGSHSAFMNRYGKLGQGTTAWQEAQFDSLQQALDPYTITEVNPPKINHNKEHQFIEASDHQKGLMKKAYAAHYERIHAGVKPQESAAILNTHIAAAMSGGTPETNPLLHHAKTQIDTHTGKGERGLVFCTYIKTMHAVEAMYPQGEVLLMHGGTSKLDRARIKNAVNTGGMCEGARGKVGGFEGVATEIQYDYDPDKKPGTPDNPGMPRRVKLRADDGREQWFDAADVKSRVRVIAGTSTISTGLNMQGTTFNIHADRADTAAMEVQRDARNFRTGQQKDVTSYYNIPNIPSGRKRNRKIGEQRRTMQGIDDPMQYGQKQFVDEVMARQARIREESMV